MIAEEITSPHEKAPTLRRLFNELVIEKKIFWILAVFILAADLASKELIISFVREQKEPDEIHFVYWVADEWFGLTELYNRGGPWGIGSSNSDILRYVRILALGVILYILASTPGKYKLQILALGLVMGGALGNIWDTFFSKVPEEFLSPELIGQAGREICAVRDFLLFDLGFPPADPWPAFNLADSAICVGVFCLALGMLLSALFRARSRKTTPA